MNSLLNLCKDQLRCMRCHPSNSGGTRATRSNSASPKPRCALLLLLLLIAGVYNVASLQPAHVWLPPHLATIFTQISPQYCPDRCARDLPIPGYKAYSMCKRPSLSRKPTQRLSDSMPFCIASTITVQEGASGW